MGRRRLAIDFASMLFALVLLSWAVSVFANEREPMLLLDMDGRTHDAAAMLERGHPVVLVFWQTWCPSCKRHAPELADAVARYAGTVSFFGVVSGPDEVVDEEQVRAVAHDWDHPQPQIRDRDLALATRFGVTGTPMIVILGRDGRVLYRGIRLPSSWEGVLDPGGYDSRETGHTLEPVGPREPNPGHP